MTAVAPAGLRLDLHVLDQVARRADRPTVSLHGGVGLSGHKFVDRVHHLAALLAAGGLGPGDRVAVLAGDHPDVLGIWVAASMLEAVTVTVPPAGPSGLSEHFDLVRPAAVLADAASMDLVPSGWTGAIIRCGDETTAPGRRPRPSWPLSHELRPCVIRFSSGTTSPTPRALVLSHRSVVLTMMGEALEAGAGRRSRLAVALPLQGAGAWFSLAFLGAGSAVVLLQRPGRLTVSDLQGFTHVVTVPEVLRRLAADLQALEAPPTVLTTGAVLPESTRTDWVRAGARSVDFYGSTESEVVTTRHDGEPIGGTAFFGAEVEAGRPGHREPIRKRGPDVWSGEWTVSGPPAFALPDATPSWVDTGDLGQLSGRPPRLQVTGRTDDVIVLRGNNLHPAEVEDVLSGVGGVQDAAVALATDPDEGEYLVAFIVGGADLDLEEVRRRCAEGLPPHKRPAEYRAIDRLPRNHLGKLLRRDLTP